jgi:hypothetical protein
MNAVVHKIILKSEQHFQGKLPSHHLGLLLAEIQPAVRSAISMALRNRSSMPGTKPNWLLNAADIRFLNHKENGFTTLFFEAPTLGEAAQEIYQQNLLPGFSTRPPTDYTGFDLFTSVLTDIQQRNTDSERYDSFLLNRITKFHRVFDNRSPFTDIEITTRPEISRQPVKLTPDTIKSAKSLMGGTPIPQRVRIVGRLDGLEASTQRFSMLLDSGEKIVGVFADDQMDAMQALWRKRVLVLGTAIFRVSGRLLRIDSEVVKSGEEMAAIFSQLPIPSQVKLEIAKIHKAQGPRSGMAAIMGQWPGDESDAEIDAALEKLS